MLFPSKIRTPVTSSRSLLPCKTTFSRVLVIRKWRSQGGGGGETLLHPTSPAAWFPAPLSHETMPTPSQSPPDLNSVQHQLIYTSPSRHELGSSRSHSGRNSSPFAAVKATSSLLPKMQWWGRYRTTTVDFPI